MIEPSQVPASEACALCGAVARLRDAALPGYKAPARYAIYACAGCGVSYAQPMASDARIYEDIYRQADRVPGYSRYYRYAKGARRAGDPLSFLASREDMYWAVRSVLSGRDPAATKIVEIGSGLGYLTYALNRAGFDALGIELSEVAVRDATARYGNYYRAADLFRLDPSFEGAYDFVVLTEVIEHVENPVAFLRAALALLRPGATLMLTTPNRSAVAADAVWQTELPPVHLWWFAEESMRYIAGQLGCGVEFVDFSAYSRRYPELKAAGALAVTDHVLDEGGNLRATQPWPIGDLQRIGATNAVLRAMQFAASLRGAPAGRRRPTMAALLRP